MAKYLDSTGVGILWGKIKQRFLEVPTKTSDLENDSSFVTSAQVDSRFEQLIGAAPADLDTLEELANKLQDGDDIHTALVQSISEKASKEEVSNNYVPKSSYTASDVLNKVKTVDGSGTGLDADLLDGKHKNDILRNLHNLSETFSLNDRVVDGGIDFTSWSFSNSSYVNDQPDGDGASSAGGVVTFGTGYPFQIYSDYNDTEKLFYRSYYNSWKDWKQFAFIDSNVASADKLTSKKLTNEDLNTIKDVNFGNYYALDNNTCANRPSQVTGEFNLITYQSGYNYIQVISNTIGSWRRHLVATTWSPWEKILTEKDIAAVSMTQSEYDALTSKNSKTLYFISE